MYSGRNQLAQLSAVTVICKSSDHSEYSLKATRMILSPRARDKNAGGPAGRAHRRNFQLRKGLPPSFLRRALHFSEGAPERASSLRCLAGLSSQRVA